MRIRRYWVFVVFLVFFSSFFWISMVAVQLSASTEQITEVSKRMYHSTIQEEAIQEAVYGSSKVSTEPKPSKQPFSIEDPGFLFSSRDPVEPTPATRTPYFSTLLEQAKEPFYEGLRGRMAGKKALLFTMDSITQIVEKSKQGGPAGEITIRKSLEKGLDYLGVSLDVCRSDEEFARLSSKIPSSYDFVFLDPWTWAGKGWQPKPFLKGQESKIFILDFFGSEVSVSFRSFFATLVV